MHRVILHMTIFAMFMGCTESKPPNKQVEKSIDLSSVHRSPVLVSSDEMDISQISNGIPIDENTVLVLDDVINEFDSSAIKNNQLIKSRAISPITKKTTGESRVIERIYYKAGEIGSYSIFDYEPISGKQVKRTYFNAAGNDGAWFTADDVISNYSLFDVQHDQVLAHAIIYKGAGVDAEWFTADDVVQHYMADVTDTNGTYVAFARFNSAGTDGIWFSADDEIIFANTEDTLDNGNYEWTQYISSGPDSNWSTLSDNEIGHYVQSIPNAFGKFERRTFYFNPGADGIRFTEDDEVGFYHDYLYDANQLFIQSVKYGEAGTDATWFTADDKITQCHSNEFNAINEMSHTVGTLAGADAICFTLDDEINFYWDYDYDINGHFILSKTYTGPGLDLDWFNSDDVLSKTCRLEAI